MELAWVDGQLDVPPVEEEEEEEDMEETEESIKEINKKRKDQLSTSLPTLEALPPAL
ncbi:cleavage and polyadenylation specificity factor subunit 2, partial [Biomphalaria glabrata]